MLVSERAIGTDQKQKYVMTVNKDKVVEYRRVSVGSLQDGLRVIESGIQPDDWVVVNGLQRARPGATVNPHIAEGGVAASAPAAAVAQKSDQAASGQSKTN
jgi:hypothetical protein